MPNYLKPYVLKEIDEGSNRRIKTSYKTKEVHPLTEEFKCVLSLSFLRTLVTSSEASGKGESLAIGSQRS